MANSNSTGVRSPLPLWMAPLANDTTAPGTLSIVDSLHMLSDQLFGLGELAVGARQAELLPGTVHQLGLLVQEHARQIRQFADSVGQRERAAEAVAEQRAPISAAG